MFVLHAHWQPPARASIDAKLIIWSETSVRDQPRTIDWRRRRLRPHPFAATGDELRALLAHITHTEITARDTEITLSLPTTRMGPQPSPGLVHDWDHAAGSKPSLLPSLEDSGTGLHTGRYG